MNALFRRCRPFFVRAAAISLFIVLADCSGGNVALAPPDGSSTTLPAATTQSCFTPSISAQAVPLSNTGGVTGSLAVAAASAAAASCDVTVTFSTGSNVVATLAVVRRMPQSTSAKPLLEISLDNAFTNNVEITGATLNTPSDLTFPDGTYQALVTSGSLPPTVLTFTASNGVLTLVSNGSPIVIFPGTTATLMLYGKGVTPPASTPTPVASASANPTATPTAAPTATASATPTTMPTPTVAPTVGAIVATSITLSPGASCIATGNAGGPISFSVSVVTNAPPGTQFEYGWESGSGFVLSVPPPTKMYTTSDLDGYTVGYANTATITAPAFPMGDLVGGSGSARVILLQPPYSYYLDPQPVRKPDGSLTIAQVNFEGGTNTCP